MPSTSRTSLKVAYTCSRHVLSQCSSTLPSCAIVGCTNRPERDTDKKLRFYNIPAIVNGQGDDTRDLSVERRRLWKAAINRKDLTTEERWNRTRVCSKHFVDGTFSHPMNNHTYLVDLQSHHRLHAAQTYWHCTEHASLPNSLTAQAMHHA